MSIKIPGINFEEGGGNVGIIIDGNVNVSLSPGQTYSVPAGKYMEVVIIAAQGTPNDKCYVNSQLLHLPTPSQYESGFFTVLKIGPGQTVQADFSNSGTIRVGGTMFANG